MASPRNLRVHRKVSAGGWWRWLLWLWLPTWTGQSQSTEWWAQLSADLWRQGRYRLALYADARQDLEEGEFAGWGAGFLNYTQVLPNLALGLHARRFEVRHHPGRDAEAGDRLEVEVNPRLRLGSQGEVTLRNRSEFRWSEDDGAYSCRLRSRAQVEWKTPESWPIRACYVNDEIFFSATSGNWLENRFVPAGVVIPVGKGVDLRVYYALRHRWFSSGWEVGHLIGTHLFWSR